VSVGKTFIRVVQKLLSLPANKKKSKPFMRIFLFTGSLVEYGLGSIVFV